MNVLVSSMTFGNNMKPTMPKFMKALGNSMISDERVMPKMISKMLKFGERFDKMNFGKLNDENPGKFDASLQNGDA